MDGFLFHFCTVTRCHCPAISSDPWTTSLAIAAWTPTARFKAVAVQATLRSAAASASRIISASFTEGPASTASPNAKALHCLAPTCLRRRPFPCSITSVAERYQTDQPPSRRHARAVQDARKHRIRAASPTKKPDGDLLPFPTGRAAGAKSPSGLQTARSLGPRRLAFNASSSSMESVGGSPKRCARRSDRRSIGEPPCARRCCRTTRATRPLVRVHPVKRICKHQDIDPSAYLQDLLRRSPSQPTDQLEGLLPMSGLPYPFTARGWKSLSSN
jgi:hypothetical protein